MYTQSINLNMDTGKYNMINVKQNDSGRQIIVSLFKDNKPFVNSFQNTKIFFKRSDNKVYFNTVEVKDNQVTFELTTEILQIIGELEVEIAFYENTNIITSIIFKMGILRSIRDDTVVEIINKNDAIADILVKLDNKVNKEYVDNLVTNIQTGGIDLTDYAKKTDLPTKVSQLNNDSNFLTVHQDISGKVDKVAGKGLSTNDYSTIEKTKLSNLNNYDDTLIKDSIALKADKTYVDQALANISGGGTIDLSDYVLKTQIASATQNGLMSLGDKIKLNTLQNYVHPENHPISIITGLQTILDSKMGKNDSYSYTNLLDKPSIPTKTSQLDNDSGFLTTHQDISTKQDKLVAGDNVTISVDNVISAKDTTYLKATTSVDGLMSKEDKTKINSLVNYDDTEIKELVNGKASTAHTHIKSEVGLGNVDNISDLDKPISTATQNALDLKADKEYVDNRLISIYKFKNSIVNAAALPTTGMEIGDVYNLEDTGANVAWAGGTLGWDNLGINIDLTGYLTIVNADSKYQAKDVTIVKDSTYVHTDNNFTTIYKTKLDGISEGANNYVHPTTHEISMISGLQTELNGKMSSNAIIDYADLSNKPSIPTKTSQLDNDSGFLTTALDLSSYATKTYVDSQVSTLTTQIGDISTILASVI